MDAYEIISILNDIGETSSRTEKERLLGIMAASDLGKFTLNWAYNSFITYGITPAPHEPQGKYNMQFKEAIIEPLLIKLSQRELTGNAAELEIAEVMGMLDKEGARLLYLILSKDLKCGIGETTINTVVPGLIPVFGVQRAHTYEPKKVKIWPQKGEFKLDGQRNAFLCHEGNGGFFTRSGKRVTALDFMVPFVVQAAAYVAQTSDTMRKLLVGDRPGSVSNLNFMLDGEAMMGLFEETGAFRRKDTDAVGAELHLYDIMSYDDFMDVGPVGEPLMVRRERLTEFVAAAKKGLAGTAAADLIQIVPQFFVNSDEEVQALFTRARAKTLASYLARGDEQKEAELLTKTIDKATGKPKVMEGIVVKNPKALYEKKKSNAWLKLKAEETEDLPIIGVFSGQVDTKYEDALGGVIVDFKGVEVRVGGGWSDEERFGLWEAWKKDAAMLCLNHNVGFKGLVIDPATIAGRSSDSFELLRRLIEVEFMEITPDGSLRHPRYIRFRDDKDGEVEVSVAIAA